MTTVRPSGLSSATTPLAANVRTVAVPAVFEGEEMSAAFVLYEIKRQPNKTLGIVGHNLIFKNQPRTITDLAGE